MVIALVTAGEARDHDKDLLPVYEALIARYPWDYHRRHDEFLHWLDEVSQHTQLHNRALQSGSQMQ